MNNRGHHAYGISKDSHKIPSRGWDKAIDESKRIAEHYNAIPEKGVGGRAHSDIYSLKKFNNWVKSVLIQMYMAPNSCVLDLCCGKGGDLQKFSKSEAGFVVGVDIADVSVEQCQQRYDNMKGRKPDGYFFAADCCVARLSKMYRSPPPVFDMVSCQFAIHYAFESEEKIRAILLNVVENLRIGGSFVATTTDACRIVKKMKQMNASTFGNSVFHIDKDDSLDLSEDITLFGSKYHFSLEDAINDCPEYLVHPTVLIDLCKEYGLKLKQYERFHEFYKRLITNKKFSDLFNKMSVLKTPGYNQETTQFDADQWEVIGFYCVFAFEKVEEIPIEDLEKL